jgi:hypothetical protein
MKLIKKSTLFRRAEIEMSEDEYKAYRLGHFYGFLDGILWGIVLSIIIFTLITTFAL